MNPLGAQTVEIADDIIHLGIPVKNFVMKIWFIHVTDIAHSFIIIREVLILTLSIFIAL